MAANLADYGGALPTKKNYKEFIDLCSKIEKDFGFNRSTRKLWVSDQVKSFFIGACINIPIFVFLKTLLQSSTMP